MSPEQEKRIAEIAHAALGQTTPCGSPLSRTCDAIRAAVCGPCQGIPDPLNNKAAALELVEKLKLTIDWFSNGECQVGTSNFGADNICVENADLCRAICECAAKTIRG